MANATHSAQAGHAPHPAAYSNVIGAAISLAVLVGIVGWGAKTLIRDSSGVPVVVALDGPMRIAPQDPGGVPASHQGLTVNHVSGSQPQAVLSDNLQLAPQQIALQDEDEPMNAAARPVVRPTDSAALELISLGTQDQNTTAQDLAAMIAATNQPQSDLAPQDPPIVEQVEPVAAVAPQPQSSAVTRSLRPNLRPVFASATPAAETPALAPAPAVTPAAVITIPKGTRMAQLGAYESQAVAEREWNRLSQRFENYLGARKHVIQTAASGGSTFYRLRVHGFADAGEARRLCSALIAQNAACYPVTMN